MPLEYQFYFMTHIYYAMSLSQLLGHCNGHGNDKYKCFQTAHRQRSNSRAWTQTNQPPAHAKEPMVAEERQGRVDDSEPLPIRLGAAERQV